MFSGYGSPPALRLVFGDLSKMVPSKKSSSISPGIARFAVGCLTGVLLLLALLAQGNWRRGGITRVE